MKPSIGSFSTNRFTVEPNYVLIGANSPTSSTKTAILAAEPDATITNHDTLYIEQKVGKTAFPDSNHPDTIGTAEYYLKQMVGSTCDISNPDVPGFAAAETPEPPEVPDTGIIAFINDFATPFSLTGIIVASIALTLGVYKYRKVKR